MGYARITSGRPRGRPVVDDDVLEELVSLVWSHLLEVVVSRLKLPCMDGRSFILHLQLAESGVSGHRRHPSAIFTNSISWKDVPDRQDLFTKETRARVQDFYVMMICIRQSIVSPEPHSLV